MILIQSSAPARPACFCDDSVWREWLHIAHESGIRIVRRVDEKQRTPARHTHYEMLQTRQIDYCTSCTESYQRRMQAQGRCTPCEAFNNRETADAAD